MVELDLDEVVVALAMDVVYVLVGMGPPAFFRILDLGSHLHYTENCVI